MFSPYHVGKLSVVIYPTRVGRVPDGDSPGNKITLGHSENFTWGEVTIIDESPRGIRKYNRHKRKQNRKHHH